MNSIYGSNVERKEGVHMEGELYKAVRVRGEIFLLYYGYYEDFERESPRVDPIPVYPDFRRFPKYTGDDYLFVTKMQDACEHYRGPESVSKECAECKYYEHGDELIGICSCSKNRKKQKGEG